MLYHDNLGWPDVYANTQATHQPLNESSETGLVVKMFTSSAKRVTTL